MINTLNKVLSNLQPLRTLPINFNQLALDRLQLRKVILNSILSLYHQAIQFNSVLAFKVLVYHHLYSMNYQATFLKLKKTLIATKPLVDFAPFQTIAALTIAYSMTSISCLNSLQTQPAM